MFLHDSSQDWPYTLVVQNYREGIPVIVCPCECVASALPCLRGEMLHKPYRFRKAFGYRPSSAGMPLCIVQYGEQMLRYDS